MISLLLKLEFLRPCFFGKQSMICSQSTEKGIAVDLHAQLIHSHVDFASAIDPPDATDRVES